MDRELFEKAQARADKYTVSVCDRLPLTRELSGPAFVGTFSVTQQPQRWIMETSARYLWPGLAQTPTEISRDYLTIKYPRRLRRKSAQIDILKAERHAPLLAVPGWYHDYVYVDVEAAYWSILCTVGWNVDYWPFRWLARGDDLDDYPLPKDKLARNYLVSAGLSDGMTIWTGQRFIEKPGNPLVNHGPYAVIMDTLHALAVIARDQCHAVYINTDGYIVPAASVDTMLARIADYGLRGRVKYDGEAKVYGAGQYEIGARIMKRAKPGRTSFADTLVRDDALAGWLQPRLLRLHRFNRLD